MLKFLENKDEVLDLIQALSEAPELSSYKIGVSGSYAQGLNKKASSIDIVLKLRDGEKESLIGDSNINMFIHNFMQDVYSNKISIIWLDLLEKDEENLLEYMRENGLEVNPESAYTNIIEYIAWADDANEKDDKISSTVMTWDEDEDNEDSEDNEDKGDEDKKEEDE